MAQISDAHRHLDYMRVAISRARLSPAGRTNFRVGAVLVDGERDTILATGYTMEIPGNTHAEQCCLMNYAAERGLAEEDVGTVLPGGTVLYTTMEPCAKRLSGNLPCVDRILRTRREGRVAIGTVYVGVVEPDTFVGENKGRRVLEGAGVRCEYLAGLEEEILEVATAGHEKV